MGPAELTVVAAGTYAVGWGAGVVQLPLVRALKTSRNSGPDEEPKKRVKEGPQDEVKFAQDERALFQIAFALASATYGPDDPEI